MRLGSVSATATDDDGGDWRGRLVRRPVQERWVPAVDLRPGPTKFGQLLIEGVQAAMSVSPAAGRHVGASVAWIRMGSTTRPYCAPGSRRSAGSDEGELRPFTIPGHKHDVDLIGEVVARDVPLYGGLAAVRDADALVRRAEARTAERFGADWCRYSVGGSTHGNQALTSRRGSAGRHGDRRPHLAPVGAARPGAGRDCDRCGSIRRSTRATGLPLGLGAPTVADALRAHPDACAVLVTSPSYVGTCADVGSAQPR